MKDKIISYQELFGLTKEFDKGYTYSPEIPTDLTIGDTVVYKDESGKYNQFGTVKYTQKHGSGLMVWLHGEEFRLLLSDVRKCYPAI